MICCHSSCNTCGCHKAIKQIVRNSQLIHVTPEYQVMSWVEGFVYKERMPVPTIQADISTHNGSVNIYVLQDSGADISIAGPSIIKSLRDHPDNMLSSQVTPRTVNGQKMNPIGKLPVQIKMGTKMSCTYTQV